MLSTLAPFLNKNYYGNSTPSTMIEMQRFLFTTEGEFLFLDGARARHYTKILIMSRDGKFAVLWDKWNEF